MTSDGDDDALSWDGDDALEARRPESPAAKPKPAPQQPSAPADPEPAAVSTAPAGPAFAAKADEPEGLSTVTLVLLGLLAGIYLLYTIGWVLGGVGMQAPVMFTLPGLFYQGALWLAVLAPALWFTAVLVTTRGGKDWVRLVWLVAGVALLVPWPFVISGGGAAL